MNEAPSEPQAGGDDEPTGTKRRNAEVTTQALPTAEACVTFEVTIIDASNAISSPAAIEACETVIVLALAMDALTPDEREAATGWVEADGVQDGGEPHLPSSPDDSLTAAVASGQNHGVFEHVEDLAPYHDPNFGHDTPTH